MITDTNGNFSISSMYEGSYEIVAGQWGYITSCGNEYVDGSLPITITLNDDVDQFGNQGPVVVDQTKEERDAKAAKTYLGNVKVVWTNGTNVEPAPRDGNSAPAQPAPAAAEEDLPF